MCAGGCGGCGGSTAAPTAAGASPANLSAAVMPTGYTEPNNVTPGNLGASCPYTRRQAFALLVVALLVGYSLGKS